MTRTVANCDGLAQTSKSMSSTDETFEVPKMSLIGEQGAAGRGCIDYFKPISPPVVRWQPSVARFVLGDRGARQCDPSSH